VVFYKDFRENLETVMILWELYHLLGIVSG
jgi:hypothetical protein